jgi:TolB-like protein/Flp pilus assembly protein TadD
VIDIQEHDGQQFIIMEYIDGSTLNTIVPVQSIEEATAYAVQIAEALQAAHAKGIVHRDVKSENIMVTSGGHIKVMDFGLAKLKGSLKLTRTSSTVGTLAYMAPEQIQGEEVDARADIFSFGVVLFEMLTGKKPFRGEHEAAMMYSILHEEPESPLKYRSDIPPHLAAMITRLLQKDPGQRPQTMSDVVAKLKNAPRPGTGKKESPPASIAVLAFEDMSPQKDHDYLCEGLAEELINALTKIERLRVSARTSAFAFKGKQLDIREIGAKLNVETVLEGSVRKSGNRLRISAQLIKVSDGYHLWSERYDREMRDVFEIQDEITENIVRALRLVLTEQEKESLEAAATPAVEAYEYYLRGRKLFHQLRKDDADAVSMFIRATEIDPGYALAYCGLADCYAFRYMYNESTEAVLHEAEKASRKAIELNPQLAEAHTSLGLAISLKKRYEEADREFRKAIELNPRLYEVHYYRGRTFFARGAFADAAQSFEEAVRVRPEDYQASALLVGVYRSLHEEEKWLATVKATLQKATRHLELNPSDARANYLGAGALMLLGELAEGERWMARALAIDPTDTGVLYNAACHYSQMGNVEKSIEYLRKALSNGFAHKEWIENDSDFDKLRSDPRFQQLLREMKTS